MSHSVRPHRRQTTRLPCPWDSPGKNTGVGCHFLLQCMKVKSESEVAQLCLTLSDPIDCSPPGSSIHGVFQTRVLEWGAIAFSEIQPNNCTYEHLCLKNENFCFHENLYTNIHNSFICNSQKLGITQMSFSRWLIKQSCASISRNTAQG